MPNAKTESLYDGQCEDFNENADTMLKLLKRMAAGETVESPIKLCELRDNILRSGDNKSQLWLARWINGILGQASRSELRNRASVG